MKEVSVYLNQSDGGMVNDARTPLSSACQVVTNFDIFTNSYKFSPYHDSESGDTAPTTSQKQNFCVGYYSFTAVWRLFSLGVVSGTGKAEILMKDLSVTVNDLSDAAWMTPSNNQSSNGSTSFNVFVPYKTTGKIYGARAGRYIWSFTPDNSTVWNDTEEDLTAFTNIAQGIVHSKDDIMYIPYDNKIAKNNAGSWTAAALTLPSNFYITSICEHGNYLAIACAPLSGTGNSVVFLWDRDSSVTTLAESIDFGEGILKILENIDGYLIGVSLISSTAINGRIMIRYYDSASIVAKKLPNIGEMQVGTNTYLQISKQKARNRLYFLMKGTFNGATREGIWCVGRPSANKPFVLSHERTPYNDTALNGGVLKGFIIVGDYYFISSTDASGNYQLAKTNDAVSYTATSIMETLINPGMAREDKKELKQLISIGLLYEALPAAGQVVCKYAVDGGSFTTVFTETTDNATYTEPFVTPTTSTGFTEGKDYSFRIESTGGAEVAGIVYKYKVIPSNV